MKKLFAVVLAVAVAVITLCVPASAEKNHTDLFQSALGDMPVLIDDTFEGTLFPAEAIVDYGFVFNDYAKNYGTVATYAENEPDWYCISQTAFENHIATLFDKVDYAQLRSLKESRYNEFVASTGKAGDSSCYYGFDSYRRGGAPALSVETYTNDGNGNYTVYAKIENSAVKVGVNLSGSTVKLCSWAKADSSVFQTLKDAVPPGEDTKKKPESKPEHVLDLPVPDEGILPQQEAVTDNLITLTESDDVKVEALSDAFPEGVFVSVIKLTKGKSFDIAKKALEKITESFYLYDISATYKGGRVEPDGTLNIEFDIPNSFGNSVAVYYIGDDGKSELLPSVSQEDGKITVNTSHLGLFSVCEVNEDGSLLKVKKSNTAWLIVLFIVLFLAVVAAVFFIVFKKTELMRFFAVKNKKKQTANKQKRK